MSKKTLPLANEFPSVLTSERFARLKVRVLASAVGLLLLTPAASFGLELGEATIRSGLGQSLLVEIPYRLAANERLTPACVSLASAPRADAGLPRYSRASRVAITPTHIEIFGDSRVLEPLLGLTVDVRCNTVPRFVRSYELFVDPPARIPATSAEGARFASARAEAAADVAIPVAQPAPVATRAAMTSNAATPTPRATVSARARGQDGGNLSQGQTYVVVRGDTLSGIAARVGDRPTTIRATAEAIFAANPGAFARGNRDLLEAGRSITIPLMTAVTAAPPVTPASIAVPEVSEPNPVAAEQSPSIEPAPTSAAAEPPAETLPSVVPDAVESPAVDVAAPQVSAAPVPIVEGIAADNAAPAASGRASMWLTTLLALGVVVALSAPLLFLRRRNKPAAPQETTKLRPSQPRRLVDPVAGFDVVEAELPRTSAGSSEKTIQAKGSAPASVDSLAALMARPEPIALDIGPVDSVDLDVGMPTMVDERVDWFADRVAAAPVAKPVAAAPDASLESAATARMPGMDATATAQQQQILEPHADVAETVVDDVQHTLTIVELDMLRQDYETEHTLTQAANKELRDAVADLKATQAARAAAADTATLEMPQQAQTESIETQPTQRLRSSR